MTKWFTFQELADELKIPVKSLYFYHEKGEGPKVHKFGKHLRVLESDFISWRRLHLHK